VRGEQELGTLDSLVSSLRVAPVTPELARAGGLLRRDYGPRYGTGLADAILAATAQACQGELSSLNVKHFPMFKDLRPAYIKTNRS